MNQREKLIELHVSGMHCNNCALAVHKLLEKKGYDDVSVNFANEEVKFSSNKEVELRELIRDIEGLGYKVYQDDFPLEKPSFLGTIEGKFIFSLVFTIPLFLHMFLPLQWLHHPYVQLALCLPVYILGCTYFGKSAWNSIRSGIPNMDVLIFVGATAAFIYSLIGTINQLGANYLFYETTATIITLVLLGNVFEKRSIKKTTSAIKDLLKIQNTFAYRLENGELEEVTAQDIKVGDTLVVNEGEQIPTDGDIIWGSASIDESMLTGESVPLDKVKYDAVIGGTLVQKGSIRMMASKVGKQTILAQIIELMKRAQGAKPPIQKLGDRVASIFVPTVIVIALLTFFITYYLVETPFQQALMNAIAVLVISCPCAMGLATPTAVMVGLGRAAKKGVLIKGGDTIETITGLKYMVFDKTGTLTSGKFEVKKVDSELNLSELASIVVALESHSNHPIAKALVSAFQSKTNQRIIIIKTEEEKGIGIKAEDSEGNSYHIGSKHLLDDKDKAEDFDVFIFKNARLVGRISLEDELRQDALFLIKAIKSMGIIPVLLSGDKKEKCVKLADYLGIEQVYFEMLPHEKLQVIDTLSLQGKTAMVGDGINDAPALTKAHVGVSLGGSSQIAIQSAQVVLLKNNLRELITLLQVGKHTMLTIKQNLFWAFFYNVAAIPMAAMGFLSPMLAALAMACSDVVVIGNSIRLKYKNLTK